MNAILPEQRLEVTEAVSQPLAGTTRLEAPIELDGRLRDLIRVRASQVNRCAFRVDRHWKDARAAGETEERLYSLDAWRESSAYSDQQRPARELCDAITLIADSHVPDGVRDRAAASFGRDQLAQLVFAITSINAWNRLIRTARVEPGRYQARTGDPAKPSPTTGRRDLR